MVEDDIKSLNFGQTIFANFLNLITGILQVYFFLLGLKVIKNIPTGELQVFGLLGLTLLFLKFTRFSFVVVYNSKDGGLIRFD